MAFCYDPGPRKDSCSEISSSSPLDASHAQYQKKLNYLIEEIMPEREGWKKKNQVTLALKVYINAEYLSLAFTVTSSPISPPNNLVEETSIQSQTVVEPTIPLHRVTELRRSVASPSTTNHQSKKADLSSPMACPQAHPTSLNNPITFPSYTHLMYVTGTGDGCFRLQIHQFFKIGNCKGGGMAEM